MERAWCRAAMRVAGERGRIARPRHVDKRASVAYIGEESDDGQPSCIAMAMATTPPHTRSADVRVGGLPDEVRTLVARAFDRYGARCLWNVPRPHSRRGVEAVSAALRRNGGMDAWWLAVELDEAAARAFG
jgi:hypothetical protein